MKKQIKFIIFWKIMKNDLEKLLINKNCDYCFRSAELDNARECRHFKDLLEDEYCIEMDDVRLR